MSVTLMLATTLTLFTPIQPEPMQFDTAAIQQEVRRDIEMELVAIEKEALELDISSSEIVAHIEQSKTELDAE